MIRKINPNDFRATVWFGELAPIRLDPTSKKLIAGILSMFWLYNLSGNSFTSVTEKSQGLDFSPPDADTKNYPFLCLVNVAKYNRLWYYTKSPEANSLLDDCTNEQAYYSFNF